MASDAGQGNSGFVGEDKEGKGKGKETAILPPQSTTQGGNPVAYDEKYESPPGDSELPSYRSALFLSKTQKFQDWNYTRRTCFIATLELKKHWEFYGSSPIWKDANSFKMASSPQLLFVDGSFAELAQEMADYIQVGEQVKSLLAKEQNEEALQAIVKASSYLNQVPEKEFTGAYNLLIHLVLQSSDYKKYLPAICGNLLKPITSSPTHGFTLAANALSTIFNLLDKTNPVRYHVFMQIVRFIRQHGQFDLLKPRLPNLEGWFAAWETDEEDKRRLYVEVADVAGEAGDDEEAYHYLVKAIATFDREDQEEITSEEAQKLSLKATRMAISSPTRFDFQDLRALPSVQALSDSHPVYAQLLDIFTEQDLEDYNDFRDEHEGWIEKEKLDHEKLQRKMRLLTFASLAASTPNREIPYANIARALQIPSEQVEMWTIDVIRAKLVEGRLSQQKQVFLVHRTTYRVFGEKQWRELGTRVDQFKSVVDRLTAVVRKAQADAEAQREREQQEIERKLANVGISGGQGGDRRRQPPKQRTDDDD